jgi:hypothetical protein
VTTKGEKIATNLKESLPTCLHRHLSISYYLSTHPALEYVLVVCNLLPVGIIDLSYYYILVVVIKQFVVVTLNIPSNISACTETLLKASE